MHVVINMRSGYLSDFPVLDGLLEILGISIYVGEELKRQNDSGLYPSTFQVYDALSERRSGASHNIFCDISIGDVEAAVSIMENMGCIGREMATGNGLYLTEFGISLADKAVDIV